MDRATSGPWQNIAVDGIIYQCSFCLGSLNLCGNTDHLCLVLFVVVPYSACAKLEYPVFQSETDLSLLDAG